MARQHPGGAGGQQALQRGERATYYLFDEGLSTLLLRSRMLHMDIEPFVRSGACRVAQIDPAELSPGEFASMVVNAVKEGGSSFVAIDSLNAYLQAMPGQTFLLLHMHELLTFLNHRSVTTMMVVGEHGGIDLLGTIRAAYELAEGDPAFRATDDCGVVFTYLPDVPIHVVEGTPENMKVTEPIDVHIADKLFQLQSTSL